MIGRLRWRPRLAPRATTFTDPVVFLAKQRNRLRSNRAQSLAVARFPLVVLGGVSDFAQTARLSTGIIIGSSSTQARERQHENPLHSGIVHALRYRHRRRRDSGASCPS